MHPSYYYIQYLLLRKCGQELDTLREVQFVLRRLGMPDINSDVYALIREDMGEVPAAFMFEHRDHEITEVFMTERRLVSLWKGYKGAKDMLELLACSNSAALRTVKMLILGGVRPVDIAFLVNKKHSPRPALTEEGVEMFRHHLWNPDVVDPSDWEDLLEGVRERYMFLSSLYGGPFTALSNCGYFNEAADRDTEELLTRCKAELGATIDGMNYWSRGPESVGPRKNITKAAIELHAAINTEGAGVEAAIRGLAKIRITTRPALVTPGTELLITSGSISDGSEEVSSDERDE